MPVGTVYQLDSGSGLDVRYTLDAEWQDEKESSVALYGVLVREAEPTDSPIAWYLLSDYPVDGLEAAQTLIRYYSYQWCLKHIINPPGADDYAQK